MALLLLRHALQSDVEKVLTYFYQVIIKVMISHATLYIGGG